MSWAMLYEAEFPSHRTGTLGPEFGFRIEYGSPDYNLIANCIQGWGCWLHPVEGGNPRSISFSIFYQEADWAAARAAQVAAFDFVGTVGTLTLQRDSETPIVYSNTGIPYGGVGEPTMWREGNLILPISFIQGGQANQ